VIRIGVRDLARRWWRADSAQAIGEYAILAGLVAVVAAGAVMLLGGRVETFLNALAISAGSGS
jgi:Flp pilus assembly pilin Flp